MLKLRCYVFASLVRRTNEDGINREEATFLEKHREECDACREREALNGCSLEAMKSIDGADEVVESKPSGSILDNLGFTFH